MKILFGLILFLITVVTYALEVDEKLTLRLLKVSNSKKTILINRGAEDGLVVGDHAKFFITTGVIARGVVEKASPSRSIWSLYRIVDPAEVTDGKVLNLKIATPVKITDDPSKSMQVEKIPAGTETMSIKDAESDGAVVSANVDDQKELDELGVDESLKTPKKITATKSASIDKNEKNENNESKEAALPSLHKNNNEWEIWSTLSVNTLSGTSEDSTAGATSNSILVSASSLEISAGLEKYFFNSDGLFKETSLDIFIHKKTLESGDAVKLSSEWLEYGAGGNYHFYHSAAATNRLIGFVGINAGIGTTTISATTATSENTVKGTNNFYSAGIGAKYTLNNGFGIRALLDYYNSREVYDFGNEMTTNRMLSGIRIAFGASCRF